MISCDLNERNERVAFERSIRSKRCLRYDHRRVYQTITGPSYRFGMRSFRLRREFRRISRSKRFAVGHALRHRKSGTTSKKVLQSMCESRCQEASGKRKKNFVNANEVGCVAGAGNRRVSTKKRKQKSSTMGFGK